MLSKTQRRHLFKLAHSLKPTHQVGKDGITDNVCQSIFMYIKAHELMKLTVLQNSTSTIEEVSDYLDGYGIETVRSIGRTLILYKENKKLTNKIVLPK